MQYNIQIPFLPKLFRGLIKIYSLFRTQKMDYADRLLCAIAKMGPVYVKCGQLLSTSPDLVGEDIAKILQKLQDSCPNFSSDVAVRIVEKEFGAKIDKLYGDFDLVPKASGSVAQIHKAKMHDGQYVAVKIIRPNIMEKYAQDIGFLYFVIKYFARFLPHKGLIETHFLGIVDLLNKTMMSELNLELEASFASEMKECLIKDENLYIPQIFWHLTTKNVLTIEWIDGVSIYDLHALTAGHLQPKIIAQKIAISFCIQAYQFGFFHGDLHPGNIIVMHDGKIALIDFGIVGRLAEKDRIAIAEILYGFIKRDYLKVAEVHRMAKYIPEHVDILEFAQHLRIIGERIVGKTLNDISISNVLIQILAVAKKFMVGQQTQLLLVQKTTIAVERIVRLLDPQINMWELATPWITIWVKHNIGAHAKIIRLIRRIIADFMVQLDT